MSNQSFFSAGELMLPNAAVDLTKFSVIACDQYTSQPTYWERVCSTVRDVPSACHLIFPEIYLEEPNFAQRIEKINETMQLYAAQQLFSTYSDSMIYLERTLKNGSVRKGLIGLIDLENYDFQPGVQNYIRATEGTVLERIPPRVKIRQNALLELPHIMLLLDDPDHSVIEPIGSQKEALPKLYQFELMEESGKSEGYQLTGQALAKVEYALCDYDAKQSERQQITSSEQKPMIFAVGDGNHSLATAKTCYETIKSTLPPEQAMTHPARWALVELVNLHDASLQFEAIHRILFQVDPAHLLSQLQQKLQLQAGSNNHLQSFTFLADSLRQDYSIPNPSHNLTVGTLQAFLDEYLNTFGGKIDYIHGEDEMLRLISEPKTAGFLLPAMEKSDLFESIILDGALPRKTFSMGEAYDKRFYLEARKIR